MRRQALRNRLMYGQQGGDDQQHQHVERADGFASGELEVIGEDFAQRYGCQLLPDPCVIDLYGTRTVLLHGDTLCTDDRDYQAFRRMVRDPQWQQTFLQKTLAEREAIAQQVRDESQAAMAEKSLAIMDVNAAAVAAVFAEHNVSRMIHGHTHRPNVHRYGDDESHKERIVLGDWYDGVSYLLCDAKGYRLVPDPS